MHFLDDLNRFAPLCEQEETDRNLIIQYASKDPEGVLLRDSALFHMTASSMILNSSKTSVLMAFHNIYQSWAWTGGHADGESDLLSLALREAREETGVQTLRPLSEIPVSLEILHVQPHVKRGKYINAHLHFNLTYALIGDDSETIACKPDENSKVGWLPIGSLHEFVTEKAMLPIYEKILSRMR